MLAAGDITVVAPFAVPLAGGGGAGGTRGGGGGELGGRCCSVICYFSTRLGEVKPANSSKFVELPVKGQIYGQRGMAGSRPDR